MAKKPSNVIYSKIFMAVEILKRKERKNKTSFMRIEKGTEAKATGKKKNK